MPVEGARCGLIVASTHVPNFQGPQDIILSVLVGMRAGVLGTVMQVNKKGLVKGNTLQQQGPLRNNKNMRRSKAPSLRHS